MSDSVPYPFENVVCGIDSSPESREAARQAAALAAEAARLWGVAVWDPGLAMHAGLHASEVARALRDEASAALATASEELDDLEPMLIRGGQVAGLLAAIANLEADLVAVGAHGISRPAGIVFGSVATAMAHHAPCSVLVARPGAAFAAPGRILHAADGSPESLEAARLAGLIAARGSASVVTMHAGDPEQGEQILDRAAAEIAAAGVDAQRRLEPGSAQREVVAAAAELEATLVVIGSRGLTGVPALGSVSERVAHRAPCSALIVRSPAHPSTEPAA